MVEFGLNLWLLAGIVLVVGMLVHAILDDRRDGED